MILNIVIMLVNIAVAGVPLWLTLGITSFCHFEGLCFVIIILLCWNLTGDIVIYKFVLNHCEDIETPKWSRKVEEYINTVKSKYAIADNYQIHFVNDDAPYYYPLSSSTIVCSKGLGKQLSNKGSVILSYGVDRLTYTDGIMLTRKCLLISLISHQISIKIMGLVGIVISIAISILGHILASVLFSEQYSLDLGTAIGKGLNFIYNLMNLVEDKIVEFVMYITQKSTYAYINRSNSC